MILLIFKLDSFTEKPISILKEGEHIIGRGDILQCNDKRASRTHASIKIENESAAITSTHQNPCFFQSANSKTVVILPKNVSTELKDGDKFGIFPDEFWFKVKFKNDDYNVMKEDENLTLESKRSLDENITTSQNKILKTESNNCVCISSANIEMRTVNCDLNEVQTQEINSNLCRLAKEKMSGSHETKTADKQMNVNNLEGKVNNEKTTDKEQPYNDEDEAIKNRIQTNANNLEDNKINIDETKNPQTNVDNLNDNELQKNDVNLDIADNVMPCSSASAAGIQNSQTSKPCRDRCWYGDNCYRKNPDHRKEFSHPGDSDYESNPNDTRPMCRYGTKCYRKNKEHQMEYRHSRNVGTSSSKRLVKKKRDTRKKTKVNSPNNSSEDDYDYDDPFLNEDSEDAYEEESWSEYDSDDEDNSQNYESDNEDTTTLMKEANRFTKRKK